VRLVFLATFVALGAFLLTFGLYPQDSTLYQKDFGQEYLLARAIRDGVDPYLPIQTLGARYVDVTGYFDKQHPTPHPPTVGLLAFPLGLLSYPAAVRVWFAFELVCLVAALGMLVRAARVPIRLQSVPLLAVALVLWPPLTLEIGLGQLMLPLLLTLSGALLALLRGRALVGGGLLGLSLLIKPIAWPWLIVLAWRRDWRALAAATAVAVAGGALSVAVIGVEHTQDYVLRVLPMMSAAFFNEVTNMSLWTVAPRLGWPALSPLLPGVVLLVAAWWVRRRALDLGLAMMTVVCLLVSPISWYFYLVLALLPLTYVLGVAWLQRLGLRQLAAIVGVFALMGVSQANLVDLARAGAGGAILLEPALALCLLGLLVAWLARCD
jgi:alpha-1,2-mannosyltransferase